MKRKASLLLVSILATVALGSACEPKAKSKRVTLYPVGEQAALDLDISYPNDDGEDETCGPAAYRRSYLLSIDTGAPGWDLRLLFDGTLTTLYGCGGPAVACTNAALGFTLQAPERVMLEALDVTPSQYVAATSGIAVLCRGLADAGVVAADVTSTVSPSETPEDPAPEPTTVVTTYTVTLRMLRVGGTNKLPYELGDVAPPPVRYGAAASYSVDAFKLGTTGSRAGRVVFAGGVENEGTVTPALSNAVHLFDPATLTFTAGPALSSARAGLTATTFRAADGTSSILFAGGIEAPAAMSDDAEVLDGSGTLIGKTMTEARGFHAASYMGTSMNMILLAGGEIWDPASPTPFTNNGNALATFDLYAPSGSMPSPTPTPCAALENGAFCSPTGGGTGTQRSGARAEYLHRVGTPHMVVIGGQNNTTDLNNADIFEVEGNGFAGRLVAAGGGTLANNSAFPATGVFGNNTGIAPLNNRPVSFGGFSPSATLSAHGDATYFPAEVATAFVRKMHQIRGLAQATVLRDQTILITGGTHQGAGGFRSIERFVPFPAATLSSSGRFEFIVPIDGGSCDRFVGPAGNCARLSVARFAHTATRLQQTRTWLDGSVLVIGGGSPTDRPAELFVPPMTCDPVNHLEPVSPGTFVDAEPFSNPTLPPLCDRDRAGEPITDPLTGAFN